MAQVTGKFPKMLLSVVCFLLAGCSSSSDGDGSNGDGSDGEDTPPAPAADISGVIAIEARTRIDSDTADDFVTGAAQSNNSNPQGLPSPALTGGYLSSGSGVYRTGFEFFADDTDQFRLTLTENQTVTIQAFPVREVTFATNNPVGDVRLLLNGSEVASDRVSATGAASVSPEIGSETAVYTVRLETRQGSGPFRYVLGVTSDGSPSGVLRYSQPEFMPDEAIVTMGSQTGNARAMGSAMDVANAKSMGYGTWHLHRSGARKLGSMTAAEKQQSQKETLTWIRELRALPGVRSVEPNYLVHAFAVNAGDDPLFRRQWHYPLISLPTAWQALSSPGEGIRVAVLDTGVFSETPEEGGNWHPDLDDDTGTGNNIAVIPGADFVSAEQDDDAVPGRDDNPSDLGNGSPQTTSFHGTHVAGTIAALDNRQGGVGVAPEATVLPIRVLGEDGEGTATDLIDAINALTDPDLPSDQRPDVINLSLGGLGPIDALQAAIQRAVDRGIIVVAAAGNQGTSERVYPAAFDNVIGVGAVDAGRRRASYSSFGNWLQLVAPGGDASRDGNNDGQADVVISPWGSIDGNDYDPAYAGLQGTSMAAPHVSGVIALMKRARRLAGGEELDLAGFLGFLRQGDLTDNVGNRTEYGSGLINAVKAVRAATNGSLDNFLMPSPSSLQFEGSVTRATILLEPFPQGSNVKSVSVESSPTWLEVTLDTSQENAVVLDAAITNLDAAEQATVKVAYNNGSPQTLELPVNVQLGDAPETRNAGRHFVLLVTTGEERETVAEVAVQPENGQYSFAFDNVPPGDYFLVAGSDVDNNGFLCEPGEACAEYPTNGFPQPITKGEATISNLSITSSFQRPALESQSLPRTGFKGYRRLGNDHTTKTIAP